MGQWAICTIRLLKFFRDFQWGLVALVGHGQLSDADSCATDGEVSRETARKQCLWFLTNQIMSMDIQLHGSDMLRHSILLMSRHCSAQVFPSLSFQTSSVHGLLRNNLMIQSVTSSRHPRFGVWRWPAAQKCELLADTIWQDAFLLRVDSWKEPAFGIRGQAWSCSILNLTMFCLLQVSSDQIL